MTGRDRVTSAPAGRRQIEVFIVHVQQRPAGCRETQCRTAPSDEIEWPVAEQHRGQVNRLGDGEQQGCPGRHSVRPPQRQTEDDRADQMPEDEQRACHVGHRSDFQARTERIGGRPVDLRMAGHQRGAELTEGIADGQAGVADDSQSQADRGQDRHSAPAQPADRDHAGDAGGCQDDADPQADHAEARVGDQPCRRSSRASRTCRTAAGNGRPRRRGERRPEQRQAGCARPYERPSPDEPAVRARRLLSIGLPGRSRRSPTRSRPMRSTDGADPSGKPGCRRPRAVPAGGGGPRRTVRAEPQANEVRSWHRHCATPSSIRPASWRSGRSSRRR